MWGGLSEGGGGGGGCEAIASAILEVWRFLPSLLANQIRLKNCESTVIFTIFHLFSYYFWLPDDSCGFKSCSMATVILSILRQVLIWGSLVLLWFVWCCCGLC